MTVVTSIDYLYRKKTTILTLSTNVLQLYYIVYNYNICGHIDITLLLYTLVIRTKISLCHINIFKYTNYKLKYVFYIH
jgi:hypothetical protein